ncbi:MAG: hypothetical protein ACK4SX_03265 [Alcanivoracaceae bacterium]
MKKRNMKKRTLAVNSFLAITAMAWLGQSLTQDNRRGAQTQAPFEQVQHQAADVQLLRYSAAERGLLRAYLRDQGNVGSPAMALKPGQILMFDQLANARTLPPALAEKLASQDAVVDLVIGRRAVRLLREWHEVIDLV